jgi:hypothetical protein
VYDLPSYVWALVLTGAIGIPAATSAVLYRGAIVAGVGRRAATTIAAMTAAVLGGWLVVSALLAGAGVYSLDPRDSVPWFLVVVAGTLIALLLATLIPIISRILADPGTPARLVLPHTLRVVGVLFLIVMALGHLPAAFALPAGLGDIAIGVSAPFVARRLARGTGHAGAVRFNVLGILDLAIAGIIGFLLLPSTAPLTLLPLALIPTTAVPLAVALCTSCPCDGSATSPGPIRTGLHTSYQPPSERWPRFPTSYQERRIHDTPSHRAVPRHRRDRRRSGRSSDGLLPGKTKPRLRDPRRWR